MSQQIFQPPYLKSHLMNLAIVINVIQYYVIGFRNFNSEIPISLFDYYKEYHQLIRTSIKSSSLILIFKTEVTGKISNKNNIMSYLFGDIK